MRPSIQHVSQACVCGVVPGCKACGGSGEVLRSAYSNEFAVALDEDTLLCGCEVGCCPGHLPERGEFKGRKD